MPRHYANLYYSGLLGEFLSILMRITCGIKSKEFSFSDECSEMGEDRVVSTVSTNHNRMFAEKLVVSHPLERKDTGWRGIHKYPHHKSSSANIPEVPGCRQQSGRKQHSCLCADGAAIRALQYRSRTALRAREIRLLRYGADSATGQSKTYDNLFPSLNVAAQTGPVRMGLNYSGKTVRPGYGQLDGAVSYINRLTFETGNPYLKPTKMQTSGIYGTMASIFRPAVVHLLQRRCVPHHRTIRQRRRGHHHQNG